MAERTEAPCKNCSKRELHCHSSCEEYKEFEQYRQAIREQKMKRVDEAEFIKAIKHKVATYSIRVKRSDERRRRK